MHKVRSGFILPSAAFTISQRQICFVDRLDRPPSVGDLVYGAVTYVGEHGTLENKEGRIHMIGDGSRAVLVFGKSTSAIACCWALSAMGHTVRASKVTGTASLKDILFMQDAGAEIISDFPYPGHPSTYMLDEPELLAVFQDLDSKYANNPANYWIVEFADGIMQRETAMLLRDDYVRKRIHRLLFSASDAAGVVGGLDILKEEFDLVPHAISGRCSSSPLVRNELREGTEIPIFDNLQRDLKVLSDILL